MMATTIAWTCLLLLLVGAAVEACRSLRADRREAEQRRRREIIAADVMAQAVWAARRAKERMEARKS